MNSLLDDLFYAGATRVVKLGGSLLDQPLTRVRFIEWIKQLSCKPTVIVVGGGRRVDDLRALDRTQTLDPRDVHWRAIEIMDDHAKRVSDWISEVKRNEIPTNCIGQMNSISGAVNTGENPFSEVKVLEPLKWLRGFEPCWLASVLPEDWTVTSDSIAAFVAQRISADELILLKPFRCTTQDPHEWHRLGIVDAHFGRVELGSTQVCIDTLG